MNLDLNQLYFDIFNKFRKGEYECYRNLKHCGKDPDFKKSKKHLSEDKSHSSAIDFLLFTFCAIHKLSYHQQFYKNTTIYMAWGQKELKTEKILKKIDFEELMDFISPETKNTKSS